MGFGVLEFVAENRQCRPENDRSAASQKSKTTSVDFSARPDLVAAYLRTIYTVRLEDNAEHPFKIGERLPWLDTRLDVLGLEKAVFITAENPGSVVFAKEMNRERTAALKEKLETSSYQFFPGYGAAPDENWQAEESFLVLGMDRDTGTKLARQFRQNAFVYIGRGCSAELVRVSD
jgi:hypothetical protein